uniref:Uncharacterized protein n=1 Tax=Rhizophora mucronata TaxID=61149 RepID=A0A2P2Q299_RHIMU
MALTTILGKKNS